MKIKAKETPQTIQFHSGDQIRVDYDDRSDYYLIVRTFDKKYALVALASTKDDFFFQKGNLYVEGLMSAETDEFVNSIDKLVKALITEDKAKNVSKVNLTLVED